MFAKGVDGLVAGRAALGADLGRTDDLHGHRDKFLLIRNGDG